jgi:DNA-binding GntR family transcriptional regulator
MQSLQTVGRSPHLPSATQLLPIDGSQQRARVSDRVLAQLLAAIRNLNLLPGQSLSETELAEQLHVSRTPLREAIARLAENGLVHVIPQVGTKVSLISMSDVRQAQFVRETLEVGAFGVACARRERDVTKLRSLLQHQRVADEQRDFEAFFQADEALHEQIFALSGFPGAWTAVQGMKVQLDRLRRLMPDHNTISELIAEHEVIVDALQAGKRAVGQKCITVHARRVLQYAPSLRDRFPEYFED